MDHDSFFHLVLAIFYTSGMCPVIVHTPRQPSSNHWTGQLKIVKPRYQNILLPFWSVVQLIILAALTIYVFTTEGIFGPHNYIGEFNDLIKVVTVYATHFTILVEGFFTRNHLSQFWTKINELDSKLLSRLEIFSTKTFNGAFVRKFFVNVVAVLLMEIAIISSIQDDPLWRNLWYLSCISLLITRLRHLHLMLHVDTISFRLKIIRKELEEVVTRRSSSGKNYNKKDRQLFQKLCVIKSAYNSLYECCSHINFSFGFSQLCNLMQNFIQLTCDLYWIYSILYRNDLTYIFVLILVLVPTFQVVIVTLSSCEKCLKEVREIGFLLHNVVGHSEKDEGDQEMDTLVGEGVNDKNGNPLLTFFLQIENFSLQILHQPFLISVTGFFNMDFTLLKAVCSFLLRYC